MAIVWREEAVTDLEAATQHIALDQPPSARKFAAVVVEAIGSLESFPLLGRPGRVSGTRELVLPNWPHIIIYAVQDDNVFIIRIPHAARRYPPLPTGSSGA